jgi:hypothetical protein
VSGLAERVFKARVKQTDVVKQHSPSDSTVKVSVRIKMETSSWHIDFVEAPGKQRQVRLRLNDQLGSLVRFAYQALNVLVQEAAVLYEHRLHATLSEGSHITERFALQISFPAKK